MILRDMREERWPSMDRVADALLEELRSRHGDTVIPFDAAPSMHRRFSPEEASAGLRFNADRLMTRMWYYPRHLRGVAMDQFAVFHVIDHSYAHLVHSLPARHTVVTCHDLDTFRCLLEPEKDPRGPLFRAMIRRILDGFRAARHVACVTAAVRDEVLRNGLLPAERLSVVYNGVDAVCSPTPDATADSTVAQLLGTIDRDAPLLLHVGSCISRKRIDLLLHILHRCAESYPDLRLLRVGGALRPDQRALADRLGVSDRIVSLPFVTRDVLAAVYRRAVLVLQPSSAEGFGLPVIEALACGTPVIASDLPVLREVGGDACIYCPVGDIDAWVSAVNALLSQRGSDGQLPPARRAAGVVQAARFSWAEHARQMIGIYESIRAH